MAKRSGFFYLMLFIWFILKLPYYLIKGIYRLVKWKRGFSNESKIQKKREREFAKYEEFGVIKEINGEYKKWINKVFNEDSQIGIVLGSRGSGKTGFGLKLLENTHSKQKKKCYALGFKKEEMPSWIEVIEDVSEIKNNSFVLIDEGGILFSSRSSMSKANKILSELIMISRHKNLSIIFISQNSSNLEVNVLRQADFLVLKKSSLLQKDFERKIVQKIYNETEKDFKKFRNVKGLTYIYSDNFKGFVSNSLPSFWKESVSKSFSQ